MIQFDMEFSDSHPLLVMVDTLRHRGPDDVGYIFGNTQTGDFGLFGGEDTPAEVFQHPSPYRPVECLTPQSFTSKSYDLCLANRRLAIVDLSPAGHQPLCNEDRSLWIVHNGEIYNFSELRSELVSLGHQFASATDTETILHAYEEWGDACVTHFNGMWAFAIWDIPRRRLFLSRDRVGIKPLYYAHGPQRFAFASEIKALLALDLPRRVNYQAVRDFLVAGLTDHTGETFFDGIRSLPPAHSMAIDLATGEATQSRYWELRPDRACPERSEGSSKPLTSDPDAQYVETFRVLFEDAIRLHLISDVPVGTCLSGGLDSASVVCMINRLIRERGLHVVGMETRQKTFSARYADPRHDEGRYIESVAKATTVDARMTYPAPIDLQRDWAKLFYHQEEPFSGTSVFAQWDVFRLARQAGVTVTLDGQGGDELLAGYWGFFPCYFADLIAQLDWPRFLAEFVSHCALHSRSMWREARNVVSNLLPSGLKSALKSNLVDSSVVGREPWLARDFQQTVPARTPELHRQVRADGSRLSRAQRAALTVSPLPSLLRFEDRNSMAHSIESRVPFLDYRLIEFCFALPAAQRIRGGMTKHILRQAMRGVIPEDVRLRQDKVQFTTPQDDWLRRDLSSWLREVFNSTGFRQRPYFQADGVLRLLERHVNGGENHAGVLWRCLAMELWHRAMHI